MLLSLIVVVIIMPTTAVDGRGSAFYLIIQLKQLFRDECVDKVPSIRARRIVSLARSTVLRFRGKRGGESLPQTCGRFSSAIGEIEGPLSPCHLTTREGGRSGQKEQIEMQMEKFDLLPEK